ncbi:hypothetical protein P3X46_023203 [Hevea brasiliensis]|uniref:Myb-like domain-containing protein n=2 Tax=Hevea brasiliensis TaxID=3981 RepID=A0ABQ9LA97_HEVBR|nr:uncharacterized protein LOC110636239 isoform X2 [Hevea brasiliensis]XP_057988395.1 uncharacterized protein LOC110636239 isoform X2 [Hevea brasiliensis]XP_057988396.1 uncharacterized protein LOC110636239 isoform X2 [Hevea brasiliensis]KAJ9163551.1 hypothetical protein P3X46_023203 [Hevea brasiliensis]
MVQKRSFNEESYSIACKHPRKVEYNNRLVSFSDFVPLEVALTTPQVPGECGLTENATEGHERLASDIIARFPVSTEKDVETIVRGRSISSFATISACQESSFLDMPVYISCPKEYFSPEHPIKTAAHHEDIYSLLLHYPPRKAVPIGLNHQADIPEWSHYSETKPNSSGAPVATLDSNLVVREENVNRLMGTCVIPMPDLELTDGFGNVRIDCNCLDEGSIRCVRQHIVESREELKRLLGGERFEEMGFYDMGEEVADKWSEEEEQLYNEVVFSNPKSLGKNFWDHLSAVFPSRSKKDIVCYYFNVFMLRRRAEQNRYDSVNIDSDDDEWLGGDDYNNNEFGMTEEDEDSVIESPVRQDVCTHNQNLKDDLHDAVDENSYFAWDRDNTNFLETCPRISLDNCDSNSHLLDELPSDKKVDQEVQDDSCISSDTGVYSQGAEVKVESDEHWTCSFNELSCGSGGDHVLEPFDVKVWDSGYMICPKSKVDFLPTCSMIDEVFGDGS